MAAEGRTGKFGQVPDRQISWLAQGQRPRSRGEFLCCIACKETSGGCIGTHLRGSRVAARVQTKLLLCALHLKARRKRENEASCTARLQAHRSPDASRVGII